MSHYTDKSRKALNRALKAMPTEALVAIKAGLETEPYVCVGTWVNNGLCEISQKSVGCLLAAAYMHTDTFEYQVRVQGGGKNAVRDVMDNFDGSPEPMLRDAFGIEWTETTDPIEDLVTAFDSWAGSSPLLHEVVEYGYIDPPFMGQRTYHQKVLTKKAQANLIGTIDRLIAERS